MEFTFVFNEQTLVSPDKYVVDQYGNRYMIFSDGNGGKFKICRDQLIINMETGQCVQRNKEINVMKI
ncbi:MAG: hypothetical protein PHU12_03005 [Candidatus Aenigmarchaeota archaeon]|nr:hypothetical protein [Candidatus Aenigmarchaeota archaeon]